ncbi:IS66 family insertion sequence element accessory protein TnpB [Pseudomonas pergaminensis]|uniref:IS66 family insertion sequence element accessory protein TnpB n=1 Tax=Pseudomonas pergaminensis TaxID=2853159 RepID=A0ABW8QYP2_9PSED
MKIFYWERNGFYVWLKHLESQRFRTWSDCLDEAIELAIQALNSVPDGIDLWRNRPHQILTPRFVAWFGIVEGMNFMPQDLPDDPVLFKQLNRG